MKLFVECNDGQSWEQDARQGEGEGKRQRERTIEELKDLKEDEMKEIKLPFVLLSLSYPQVSSFFTSSPFL